MSAPFQNKRILLIGGGIAAAVLFGALIFAFAGPRTQPITADEQRNLIVGLSSPAQARSVDTMETVEDYELMSKLHLSLVTVDSANRVYPALASSWTVLKDGQEFIFHLNPNITFASGEKVVCADALKTFEYLIKMREIDSGLRSMRLVTAIGCKSDRDLFVRLKQQSPFFLIDLSDTRYSIRHDPENPDDQLNGLGPYRISRLNPETGEILLRRRENHPFLTAHSPETIEFRVIPNLDEAKRLLASGQIHLLPVRSIRTEDDVNVVDSNRQARIWMLILSKDLSHGNPALAACIGAKIDRRAILNEINDRSFIETATLVPVSPAILLSSVDSRQFPNDDCAKYATQKLRFMYMDHFDPQIFNPIVTELSRLGIRFASKTGINKIEISKKLGTSDYDIALYSVGVNSTSVVADLASFYGKNSQFPPSNWVDSFTSRVAEQLVRSRSELEVRDLITTLVSRTLHKGPLLPLFYETERYLAGRCIQVTDYDAFRSNQQFAVVGRQKDCL